jgi:RimJ/RimL family protein N-acetyltransferase
MDESADPLPASHYVAVEALRDGRKVEIRSLRPQDRSTLVAAAGRASAQSLYRRFFAVRRNFSEREIDFFVNVDFTNQVALVAVMEEAGRPTIVGGARYVLLEPGKAEVAFAIIDDYQGHGIGSVLLRHLVGLARAVGIKELIAEVLPEDIPMLKVFERSGLRLATRRESGVVHVSLAVK